MRDIKFRAWDRKHKCMWRMDHLLQPKDYEQGGVLEALLSEQYTQFGVSISHVGLNVSSNKDYIIYDLKDFRLMQYTGLKDKNGVGIYEGDILKTNLGLPGIFPGRESYMHFSIEFEPGRFVVQSAVTKDRPDIADVLKLAPCEVIGNIYENPELLK